MDALRKRTRSKVNLRKNESSGEGPNGMATSLRDHTHFLSHNVFLKKENENFFLFLILDIIVKYIIKIIICIAVNVQNLFLSEFYFY